MFRVMGQTRNPLWCWYINGCKSLRVNYRNNYSVHLSSRLLTPDVRASSYRQKRMNVNDKWDNDLMCISSAYNSFATKLGSKKNHWNGTFLNHCTYWVSWCEENWLFLLLNHRLDQIRPSYWECLSIQSTEGHKSNTENMWSVSATVHWSLDELQENYKFSNLFVGKSGKVQHFPTSLQVRMCMKMRERDLVSWDCLWRGHRNSKLET